MQSIKTSGQRLVLGYWDYPGRAQHIRLLLNYTKLSYTEKRYKYANRQEWFQEDKQKLGLVLPNVPYLIDSVNNISITESTNIMGYIADISENNELKGKGNDKYMVDNIRFMLDDIGARGFGATLKTPEKKLADWNTVFLPKLKDLAKLYEGQDYALGYLTIADFYVFQRVNDFKSWFPEEYKEIASTYDRVLNNIASLPGIKEYVSSEEYIKYK